MTLFEDLDRFGKLTAVVGDDLGCVSYQQLLLQASQITEGIGSRTLAAVVCDNSADSLAGYIGLQRRGCVTLLLNSGLNEALLRQILDVYRPQLLYVDSANPVTSTLSLRARSGSFGLFETGMGVDTALHPDLSVLLTTSGSTGSPKFVRLSTRNLTANADAICAYLGLVSTDRAITTMPMGYSYGLSIVHSHLRCGGSLAMTDASVMEGRFWKFLKESEATNFGGVPYIFEMLKRLGLTRVDLGKIRILTQAGGKLGAALCAEFGALCAERGISFYAMYGQTEATARMAYLPPEQAVRKAGSIGRAIPGGRFWLEDENGSRIEEAGVTGELVYAGENVSLGYAEDWRDLAKGDELGGVLRTGDLARADAEGDYQIVGRKKRFIKLFGHRVNLSEVEALIRTAGYDCACAGSDDSLRIYLTDGTDKKELSAFLARTTGLHPRSFRFITVDSIARNDAGKILYAQMEAKYV